ncbi:hypothetical protein ABZ829_12185 [Streptomyces xanthochromogenes]|uniref:hypothetical protein n=1 Tax=Streptomyces xanthochromogenes TaxID=67384 RepID=UPI00344781C4
MRSGAPRHYSVEELTFADADAILSMLRELCPNLVDGQLPVSIRNLAYRPVLLAPEARRADSSARSRAKVTMRVKT